MHRAWQVGGIYGRSVDLLLHCVFDVSSGRILVLGMLGMEGHWHIGVEEPESYENSKLERIGMLGKSSTLRLCEDA